MEIFKYIMTVLGIWLTLAFYACFFITLFNEKISEESNLLSLVIALQLTTMVKQNLKELKD